MLAPMTASTVQWPEGIGNPRRVEREEPSIACKVQSVMQQHVECILHRTQFKFLAFDCRAGHFKDMQNPLV